MQTIHAYRQTVSSRRQNPWHKCTVSVRQTDNRCIYLYLRHITDGLYVPKKSTVALTELHALSLTAGGIVRVTARVTLGLTSIDKKRTSCAELNKPI